jgi:hydroxymethylbilane synthase
LIIAAVLAREDPRDALVLRVGLPEESGNGSTTSRQPTPPTRVTVEPPDQTSWPGEVGSCDLADSFTGVIGTGSPRRIAQLRRLYPAAKFAPIRGNVDTRLRKLDAGDVDMLVLACAGLRRLGLADRISVPVATGDCVPAPGQGIIAIEVRSDDERTLRAVGDLNDVQARIALAAEQAVVAALGGGCQLPLGVFAEPRGSEVALRAVAASVDGSRFVHGEAAGNSAAAVETGTRLAQDLAARGALELLHS